MTNEEIKKSLKICTGFPCEGCSYDDNFGKCVVRLKEDARELIIKQENEIEKLKAENIRLTTKLGQVLLSLDTVKEMNTMCSIDEQVKQAKIDVLNELKKYSYCDNDFIDGKWHRYVFVNDIDVLLEKYANENHRY